MTVNAARASKPFWKGPAGDYIDQVVAQENFSLFNKKMGNLSVRTDPPVATYRGRQPYSGTKAQPTQAELRYYAVTLWGALFAPDQHGDVRPAFEFVNVGKYSVSTSSNQRKLFSAVDDAPRRYTPCLVIDPENTGGRHWEPRDWTAMQVALDWCMENNVRGNFQRQVATPAEVMGYRVDAQASLRLAAASRSQPDLARAIGADAFWLLETQRRTP